MYVLNNTTEYSDKAKLLAKRLGVEILPELPMDYEGLYLQYDEVGLALRSGELKLYGDFAPMKARLKRGAVMGELLVKAAKIKDANEHPLVIDATAGLGEDSILLAAAGFRVKLYEYDKVIAELLEDAMNRAAEDEFLGEIVGRMELCKEDSVKALQTLSEEPAVVFLDPMFPERQKSALVKRKFQLLQQLERPCAGEEELLAAAISARPRKIVIKRPIKGPYLAGRKPDYTISGKAIRYDCLVFAQVQQWKENTCEGYILTNQY